MQIITDRFVFTRETLEAIRKEDQFKDSFRLGTSLVEGNCFFLAVFVGSTEPTAEGTRLIKILSSTIVHIHSNMVRRLRRQGVHLVETRDMTDLLKDMVRAHYISAEHDFMEAIAEPGS